MVSGSVLYQKNWFRNERSTHETVPRTHIRKVSTGREGSSVVGTVRATCLIGEFSSSGSGFSEEDDGSKLESPPFDTAENREIENVNYLLQRCEERRRRAEDLLRGEVISWEDSSIVSGCPNRTEEKVKDQMDIFRGKGELIWKIIYSLIFMLVENKLDELVVV